MFWSEFQMSFCFSSILSAIFSLLVVVRRVRWENVCISRRCVRCGDLSQMILAWSSPQLGGLKRKSATSTEVWDTWLPAQSDIISPKELWYVSSRSGFWGVPLSAGIYKSVAFQMMISSKLVSWDVVKSKNMMTCHCSKQSGWFWDECVCHVWNYVWYV